METTIENMHLDGGCLCLDFINTVHSRTERPIRDYFSNYEDVIRWTRRTSVLTKREQKELADYANSHPAKAADAFKVMIRAREELFDVFWPATENRKPSGVALKKINRLLSVSLSHLRLVPSKQGIEQAWETGANPLLLPLWMVVKSAYDVLTEESWERIKGCPSCLWLFLDKTKNNRRRWCNSLTCGSIDKATRYYYRKKEESVKKVG